MSQIILDKAKQFERLIVEFPEFKYIGDPVLRTPTQPAQVNEGIEIGKKLGDILVRYRKFAGFGRGLAAPQIGISKSVFVTYLDDQVQTYINPKIVNFSEAKNHYRELCLSCGFLWGDIKRASKITMRWTDENGKVQEKKADGVLARLWQHEYKHLEGELNLDIAEPGSIEFITRDPLQEKLRDSK